MIEKRNYTGGWSPARESAYLNVLAAIDADTAEIRAAILKIKDHVEVLGQICEDAEFPDWTAAPRSPRHPAARWRGSRRVRHRAWIVSSSHQGVQAADERYTCRAQRALEHTGEVAAMSITDCIDVLTRHLPGSKAAEDFDVDADARENHARMMGHTLSPEARRARALHLSQGAPARGLHRAG